MTFPKITYIHGREYKSHTGSAQPVFFLQQVFFFLLSMSWVCTKHDNGFMADMT